VAKDDRVRHVRNRVNIGVAGNFNQIPIVFGRVLQVAAYEDLCSRDFLLRCVEFLDRDPGVVLAYPRTVLNDLPLLSASHSGRLRETL
jgi:hypothetical protein